MAVTPGTWSIMGVNLPDFGWTEKNAPALGENILQPPAPTFGSGYTGPTGSIPQVVPGGTGAPYQETRINPQDTGFKTDFKGYPTGLSPEDVARIEAEQKAANTNTGPTGDDRITQLLKTDRNPVEEEELRRLMASLQPDTAAIESAYRPVMDYLSGEESRISGQLPSVLQSAQEAFNVSKGTLGTSRQQQEAMLGEQDTSAEQSRISAENDARRLYDQLMRGGIQRFGGATSAGQGYQSLLGVEQQRSNAALIQQYNTAKREIQTAKVNLAKDYENKLLTLEQQLRETQSTIRREFDDRIAQIRSMKAESEGAKATAQLNALQDMKNKMYQLGLSTLEYKRNLQAQADQSASQIAQADTYWDSLVSGAQGSLNNFNQQAGEAPQTAYNLGAVVGSDSGFNPIGKVNKRRDEELYGNMA